jgi:two-component system NtrC family sensor kinase
MSNVRDRILLVEHQSEISDLIARQTLAPMGYQVEIANSAATAIQDAARLFPDVIIANMRLPGLSGKDLLVALASQGLDIPVIIIAEKGQEGDIIQVFRLGAADYLLWPARDAEVLSVVERALKQVRARRERESLARQLHQTNQELQRRVRELTAIFALGKAVTSITDQASLLSKIVEGAVLTAEADCGWLLLRDDNQKSYVLGAQHNLPAEIAQRVNYPWDDGISSLVGVSGEILTLHGEPLKRFKVSRLGSSVLVAPVKARNEVVGLLTVLRKAARPFSKETQALMNAVADYATIAIMNARLFKALDDRARTLQHSVEQALQQERAKTELVVQVGQQLHAISARASQTLTNMLSNAPRAFSPSQQNLLRQLQEDIQRLVLIAESLHDQ